jgi:excinuclease UvrABC helicase subunit UvrB
MISEMEKEMNRAAAALEFEKAANLRDEIGRLREQHEKKAS